MKDGFFKREAKAMLWMTLAVPAIGVAAAVIIPHLSKNHCPQWGAFSIALTTILFIFLTYLAALMYLGQSSRKWVSTIGNLIEFRVVNARFISVKLKYEYVVDGKKYIGKRISYLNPTYKSEKAIESDKFCNHIKQGEFEVYYSEKCPNMSTLQTGFKGWFNAIFIMLLLLTGICGIIVNSAKYNRQEPKININDQQRGGTQSAR